MVPASAFQFRPTPSLLLLAIVGAGILLGRSALAQDDDADTLTLDDADTLILEDDLTFAEDAPALIPAPAPTPAPRPAPAPSPSSYIIGPGDVFDLRLHGIDGSTGAGIPVMGDGTLSYLEARRVPVAGLTIPAARAKLEAALAESILTPQLIMNPQALGSKKYTILGMVRANGTYPIAERVTLLEAIAQSGGLVDGAVDFDRSFLSRGGNKIPVDFKKLYSGGDLSQNQRLQNGDYVYIASVTKDECYVFGAVGGGRGSGGSRRGELIIGAADRGAGVIPMGTKLTVMGAITAAGGYSPEAWKRRVLVVRGSLDQPELLMVNTDDILTGKGLDVLVEPGDIIYVHTKPWSFPTQLVDVALRSFVTASISRAIDVGTSVGL
ncbi:hypothetical protein BH23VER1_BH23VER1_18360 [soil metagenome]